MVAEGRMFYKIKFGLAESPIPIGQERWFLISTNRGVHRELSLLSDGEYCSPGSAANRSQMACGEHLRVFVETQRQR